MHAAIRRDEDPEVADNVMTAADMIQAMRLYERMRREDLLTAELGRGAPEAPAEPASPMPVAPPLPAAERIDQRIDRENVRPLAGSRGRSEAV